MLHTFYLEKKKKTISNLYISEILGVFYNTPKNNLGNLYRTDNCIDNVFVRNIIQTFTSLRWIVNNLIP